MKNVFIVAHFCSMNLGDRYQGRIFADMYGCKNNVKYVNLNDTYTQNDKNTNGEMYEILSPNHVDKMWCELCIFLIGSYNGGSNYVKFANKILSMNKTCKIIFWGGFTCVNNYDNNTYFSNFDIFKNENVFFYGRSQAEIDLFDKITNYEVKNNRSLGGDPLIYYSLFSQNKIKNLESEKLSLINCDEKEVAYITSKYFFRNYPTFFHYLIKKCDIVISLDPYDDKMVIDDVKLNYPNKKILKINNPNKLLQTLCDYKLVITNRLHGGILSLSLGKHTIMVPSDNALGYENSFKYHSVALSGSGKLCEVYDDKYNNYMNFDKLKVNTFYNNISNYMEITNKTINQINELILN